jgi:hypothetical protein
MSEILRVIAHGFDRESALGQARELAELYFGPGVELAETVDAARIEQIDQTQEGALVSVRFEVDVSFRVKTATPDVRA